MEVQVKLVPSGIDEDGEEQFLELDAAIIDTLKPLLINAVCKKVDTVTDTIIKEIVRDHVAKLSVDAFERVFQASDMWSTKRGDPKSLPEIVSKLLQTHLDEKVDDRGVSSYGGDRITRYQWMVITAVRQACKGEIDERLKTLRAEFAEHIATKLSKVKVS